MKRLRGVHVAWSRLHGALELPKRVPPAPLLEIDAPKVHERELARLVASRLLGLPQPGDGLVELPLMNRDAFIRHIGAGLDVHAGEAERVLGAVYDVLTEAISAGEISEFERQIPPEIGAFLRKLRA
jgi:uncharacterized protein (DUF2267 family)